MPQQRLDLRRARVADVEEITQRAGSFKKFAVFLQMLRSALEEGGSVSLDILTYADLQALKRRKAGQPETGAQTSAGSTNNKRYIIVTYESQFDRCAQLLLFAQQRVPEGLPLTEPVCRWQGALPAPPFPRRDAPPGAD